MTLRFDEPVSPRVRARSSATLLGAVQAEHQAYSQGAVVAEHGQSQEDRRRARALGPALDALFHDLGALLDPDEPDEAAGADTSGALSWDERREALVELYGRITDRWDALGREPPTLRLMTWSASRATFLAHLKEVLELLDASDDDGGDGDVLTAGDLAHLYLDAKERRAAARSAEAEAKTRRERPLRAYRATERFEVGERVDHKKFGVGEVTAVAGNRITVSFDDQSRALVHAPAATKRVEPMKRVDPRAAEAEDTARRVAEAAAAGKITRVEASDAPARDAAAAFPFATDLERPAVMGAFRATYYSLEGADMQDLARVFRDGSSPLSPIKPACDRLLRSFTARLGESGIPKARARALTEALESKLGAALTAHFHATGWPAR